MEPFGVIVALLASTLGDCKGMFGDSYFGRAPLDRLRARAWVVFDARTCRPPQEAIRDLERAGGLRAKDL